MLAQAGDAVVHSGITGNLHIGLAALGSALAVGIIGYKASEAVGRNPGAATPILIQAILSALIGYAVGITLSFGAILATKKTTLSVVMTPNLAMGLLALTIGMCIIAAISAIFKVTRIDPAGVFSR